MTRQQCIALITELVEAGNEVLAFSSKAKHFEDTSQVAAARRLEVKKRFGRALVAADQTIKRITMPGFGEWA